MKLLNQGAASNEPLTSHMVDESDSGRLVSQKITRFEGVIITNVFFTNSSVYGRIMVTYSMSFKKQQSKSRVMIHRIKDLITEQSTDKNGNSIKIKPNCKKLGVYVP